MKKPLPPKRVRQKIRKHLKLFCETGSRRDLKLGVAIYCNHFRLSSIKIVVRSKSWCKNWDKHHNKVTWAEYFDESKIVMIFHPDLFPSYKTFVEDLIHEFGHHYIWENEEKAVDRMVRRF